MSTSYSIGDLITRNYAGFTGVDFLNPSNSVNLNRSPDAKNVWKTYSSTQSNIIQTRPGIQKIDSFGDNINGFFSISNSKVLVHRKNELLLWNNFPLEHTDIILRSDMKDAESVGFIFESKFYILDGKNYLVFNPKDNTIKDVADDAYVPTTTISREPLGGGEMLEDINVLTGQRINTFCSDGTSTEYLLDSTEIDSVDKVVVEDEVLEYETDYTYDLVLGKVIFTTAPIAAGSEGSIYEIGADNVQITFTREVEGYKDRILKCTKGLVFDNRIFFSGNSTYPNAVFHCSGGTDPNPAYISDLDYYQIGSDENEIKSIVVGNNVLWILKEENQTKDTIFYMSPNLDSDYGKVYPVSQGNISVGCISKATNYKDSIVYLSKFGLESISGSIDYEQSVTHRSTMVDAKMLAEGDFSTAKMTEYNGYLMIYENNHIYLADYRQTFKGTSGNEYEWYYWEFLNGKELVILDYLRVIDDTLYIADHSGNIYKLYGTNDDGRAIESYWTTPRDAFGYFNHVKMINKRGSILKMKNIQNGKVKISVSTNKAPTYTLVKEAATKGFNFKEIDFANFSFSTTDNTYIVFRAKRKKIIDVSIKVGSDELNKPFGLIAFTLEAYLGGYVKRS